MVNTPSREVINAAKRGDLERIKELISIGTFGRETIVDIHAKDDSAFRHAARFGHLNVVKYYISETNVNVHAKNDYALQWTIKNGHTKVVERLMSFIRHIHTQSLNQIAEKHKLPNDIVHFILTFL